MNQSHESSVEQPLFRDHITLSPVATILNIIRRYVGAESESPTEARPDGGSESADREDAPDEDESSGALESSHPARRKRDGANTGQCEWHTRGERCPNNVTHEVGEKDGTPNLYVCTSHADEVEMSATDVPIREFPSSG